MTTQTVARVLHAFGNEVTLLTTREVACSAVDQRRDARPQCSNAVSIQSHPGHGPSLFTIRAVTLDDVKHTYHTMRHSHGSETHDTIRHDWARNTEGTMCDMRYRMRTALLDLLRACSDDLPLFGESVACPDPAAGEVKTSPGVRR